MTLNAGKCHFMCLGWDAANETFIVKNLVMTNSKNQKIVGVTTDNKLNCKIVGVTTDNKLNCKIVGVTTDNKLNCKRHIK